MDTGTLVLIEVLLIFGVVLAFGVRELLSLRRDKQKSHGEKAGDDGNAP